MNEHLLPFFAFALVFGGLMIIAFRPAWCEWRTPTDCKPLAVSANYSSDIDHFATGFRAMAVSMIENRSIPTDQVFAFVPNDPDQMDWPKATQPLVAMHSIKTHNIVRCKSPLFVDGNIESSGRDSFHAIYARGTLHLGPSSEILEWVHAEGGIILDPMCNAPRRMSSTTAVNLDDDCSFERINAPVVRFGGRRQGEPRSDDIDLIEQPLSNLKGAIRRTPSLYMIKGDCELPSGRLYRGSLIVTGHLSIGAGTRILGDVKARKGILVGSGALIGGSLICEQKIQILDNAFIKGPLISETIIIIGAYSRVGVPELPTTVSAENIVAESGVTAHGTVWARELGVVWSM